MSWTRSKQERRWWTVSLVYLVAIYLSLYPLQFVMTFLRERNLLRLSMAALFAATAAVVVAVMRRRRATRREWLALLLVGAVYLLLLSRMTIIQERLHLIEYGALALGFRAALVARAAAGGGRAGVPPSLGALLLATGAGWLDEGIQAILPNRVYDLRDVGFNGLAAGVALLSSWTLDRARPTEAFDGTG